MSSAKKALWQVLSRNFIVKKFFQEIVFINFLQHTRRMVYKGFAEKYSVLKTLKFSIFSVLTTLKTTLIFKDHFSIIDGKKPDLLNL